MALLNTADAIYIGATPADKVYLGSNLVWEPAAGGPWTPHEIETGMYGWWDASIPESLTFIGVNLLEIAGQGPGGLHMGRAASSGPTATTINGLGALAITYDQGLMTPSATTFNDFTIFAVWNPGFSDGVTYERIVDHSYAAGWWFGRTGGTATFGGGIMEGPEVGYGIFVPLANNEVHQISNVREGAVHRISGNGGSVTNSRAIHTSATASNRVYMGQDNLGTSDLTDGKIGEVIIWSRAISTDDMRKTEGYLAHKWGIQAKLPADHPYKAAPPMLGGPPPLPVTAGLAVRHDASQLSLADGASVTAWPNLGSGNAATLVGTPLPTFKAAVTPTGLPAVRFTGDGAGLRGDNTSIYSPGFPLKHSWTMLYVARRWGTLGGRCFTAPYPEGENVLIGYHTSGYDCMHQPMGWIKAPTAFPATPPDPWKLYAATDQESVGVKFYINGVQQGGLFVVSAALNYYYNLNGYYRTSGGNNSTAGEGGDFDVCELLIYDRVLSDAERAQVEDYLRAKWGVAPPAAADFARPAPGPMPPPLVMP
jgi:hypothetical protein